MSLLLGGLITLAVTAVVQILIIPWVQRRNRIRERWEKDVIELITLFDEELGEPLRRFRYEMLRLSDAQERTRRRPGERRPDPDDETERLRDGASHAWDALDALTTRMTNLTFRVIRVNQAAPRWGVLMRHTMKISSACAQLNPSPWGLGFDSDRDALLASLAAMADGRMDAVRLLQRITDSMTPPRTYPARRFAAWGRRQPARLRARLRRTPAVGAADDT